MYPIAYGDGTMPVFDFTNRRRYYGDLPDEVKQAIESRREEIETEDDIDDIIEESYYRR